MGVSKLWPLLKEYGEGKEVSLSECSGESWAVDLSVWIMNGSTAKTGPGVSDTFILTRTVFFRALHLLKNGIRPIFVMDSTSAPEVKATALNDRYERSYGKSKKGRTTRVGLEEGNNLCQTMLEALGLKVIRSTGEAEKTCACLNIQGIVDACLTDDSDILLYGAKKVYKFFNMKNNTVEKHTLSDIENKLNLSRQDLVLMGLLGTSDYSKGVKDIGPKKIMQLISAIKRYSGDEDILTRVCSWRENAVLEDLFMKKQQITKPTHCTKCGHTGNKTRHARDGCSICNSEQCENDNGKPCTCDFHKLEMYKVELKIRQKALEYPRFPDLELKHEFLDNTESFDFDSVSVVMPDWKQLRAEVPMSDEEIRKKMIPVLVFMHLHGILPDTTKPIRILKKSQEKHVPCFKTLWKEFVIYLNWKWGALVEGESMHMKDKDPLKEIFCADFDNLTPGPSSNSAMTPPAKQLGKDNPYYINIPQALMDTKYSNLVDEFNLLGETKKGKRPTTDATQGTIKDSLSVKRKLFEDGAQPSKQLK